MSQGRLWLCTLNNPEEGKDPDAVLNSIHVTSGADYTVGQLERGEQGTVHLQFAIHFKKPKRLAIFKKINKAIHAEVAKKDVAVYDYVQKEETRVAGPWSFGVKPVIRSSKKDWDEVWMKAKVGDIESIPKDIVVQHYRNL